jgi:hypothetical protein
MRIGTDALETTAEPGAEKQNRAGFSGGAVGVAGIAWQSVKWPARRLAQLLVGPPVRLLI